MPVKRCLIFLLIFINGWISAQTPLYFPSPDQPWDTISTTELSWCPDSLESLQQYLADKHTKAFMILKDGRIAIEWYFDDFTQDSIWYWASAAKSLQAMLVGIAQEEGHLKLTDTVSNVIGKGWTSCSPEDEEKITIWNQVTMTSGLDDGVPDNHCTLDTCLQCLAEPGTRWAYHNAPYTLLRDVMESATGMDLNIFYRLRVGQKIGASGLWVRTGYNNLFVSDARSMARYGLLVLAKGIWDGIPVINDMDYVEHMTLPSQTFNKSYGYLWWLNGQGEHMLPGLQFVFQGDLIPAAPEDLFAALGKNDQKIYVVPSKQMVVVRMGNAAGSPIPALSGFDNMLWEKIESLECQTSHIDPASQARAWTADPNPCVDHLNIRSDQPARFLLYDLQGRLVRDLEPGSNRMSDLEPGLYFIRGIQPTGRHVVRKMIKQ